MRESLTREAYLSKALLDVLEVVAPKNHTDFLSASPDGTPRPHDVPRSRMSMAMAPEPWRASVRVDRYTDRNTDRNTDYLGRSFDSDSERHASPVASSHQRASFGDRPDRPRQGSGGYGSSGGVGRRQRPVKAGGFWDGAEGGMERSVSLSSRATSITSHGNRKSVRVGSMASERGNRASAWHGAGEGGDDEVEQDGGMSSGGLSSGASWGGALAGPSGAAGPGVWNTQQAEAALRASMKIATPQALRISVLEVNRTAEGRLVFVIEAELDGVKWSVLRQEKEVLELHKGLSHAMHFVPPPPIAKPRWPLGSRAPSAEAAEAAGQRLQSYVRQVCSNGQWMTGEAAVLRSFLQVPITQEQLQAKALVLEMTSSRGGDLLARAQTHREVNPRHSYHGDGPPSAFDAGGRLSPVGGSPLPIRDAGANELKRRGKSFNPRRTHR